MQAKNNNDHYDYTMIYYDDYNSNRFLLCYNNMQRYFMQLVQNRVTYYIKLSKYE